MILPCEKISPEASETRVLLETSILYINIAYWLVFIHHLCFKSFHIIISPSSQETLCYSKKRMHVNFGVLFVYWAITTQLNKPSANYTQSVCARSVQSKDLTLKSSKPWPDSKRAKMIKNDFNNP